MHCPAKMGLFSRVLAHLWHVRKFRENKLRYLHYYITIIFPIFIEDDPSFDSPVLDLVAFYKGGYPNGPIWKTLFSPDGIVLGYFYVEKPQLPNTPNSVFEFR